MSISPTESEADALALQEPRQAEKKLLVRCKAGSRKAYGELVQLYMKRAYFTALGIVGAHEAALDLSQDAFIKAWRHIHKIDVNRKFFTWYYTILRNLCLNHLRDVAKHARPFTHVDPTELLALQDEHSDTAKRVERNEIQKAVWHALGKLKDQDRELLILREFQGFSYKEIAEMLACPVGTVMSRLYNARNALKNQLDGFFQ